jgi:hypothetical protein
MRTAFVSFASTNMSPKPLERIRQEAHQMEFFDEIHCMTEHNLDQDFLNKHLDWMSRIHQRGFGGWIWKSQCVKQVLSNLKDGDALVYADAGCVLNKEGLPRLKEYIQMALDSPHKNVSFAIGYPERHWTKADVFQALNYTDYDTTQLVGGIFVLIKTPEITDLVHRWNHYCQQYNLIGDFPSYYQNDVTFQDHRHDQSIFSILRKQFGTVTLSDETWWPEKWDLNKHYPIHARRMKG